MSGWQHTTLSDVLLDAKPGFACGEDPGDGVFQFRMNNITVEGQIDVSKRRRVPRDTRNLDSLFVERGDVLFNATNSPDLVGKSAYFPGLDEPATFSNHFLRLRSRQDRIDGRFLARWLNLQFRRGVFKGMCRQWVNQAAVSRDSLLALRLPLPPLPEQRRIADLLDRAEALRAKRRAVLAQLDTLTQSIFHDLFGDPATNPKSWPVRSLSSICRSVSDIDHKMPKSVALGIPFISAKDLVDHGEISFSDVKFISDEDFRRLSRKGKPERNDIIYSRIGVNLGKARLVNVDVEFLASYSCCTIKPNHHVVDKIFLCHVLDSPSMLKQAHRGVRAIAVPDLGLDEIRNFSVVMPPLPAQHEFSHRVGVIEKLKTSHRTSLTELDALFASLQHRAFRGEL